MQSTGYEREHNITASLLVHLRGDSKQRGQQLRCPMKTEITYQQLIEAATREVELGRASGPGHRGRVATLERALRTLGLNGDCAVGPEMRGRYAATERSFASTLKTEGVQARNLSNQISHLRWWRRHIVAVDKEFALQSGNPTPFQSALKSALGRFPVKRVARQTSVSHDRIFGWLKGKIPRKSSYPEVRRVERFLGLERDALIRLLGDRSSVADIHAWTEVPEIEYRKRLREATRSGIGLGDPGPQLKAEWADLIVHKTGIDTVLERSEAWRTSPHPPHRKVDWYCLDETGAYVPTAGSYWHILRYYLAYVRREMCGECDALPMDAPVTLAWFVLDDAISRYVKFKMGGAETMHQGVRVFLGYAMTLLRKGTGYVRQRNDLQLQLPLTYQMRTWDELCDKAMATCQKVVERYKDLHAPSRNPHEPIRSVLGMSSPLDAVVDMLNRMRAEMPVSGGVREASWMRDIVLMQVLASVPLRAKNLRELTWKGDGNGQLYQRSDGSWHIRVPKHFFKNFKGAARDREFDTPLPPSTWRSVTAYIRQYRPLLLRGHENQRVFITTETARKNCAWADLGKRVSDITRRFLWNCPGVGPHAFRHIVATAILRADPGNFQLAAMVLHDRADTVEARYAWTKSGDAARRVEEVLGPVLKRL